MGCLAQPQLAGHLLRMRMGRLLSDLDVFTVRPRG